MLMFQRMARSAIQILCSKPIPFEGRMNMEDKRYITDNLDDIDTKELGKALPKRISKGNDTWYLKTGEMNPEAYREYDMLQWLHNKLPVPEVLYWYEDTHTFHLLTSSAVGTMACTERGLSSSEEDVVAALADGLLQFQGVDISLCPITNCLEQRLEAALYNIEHDLVDMDDFAENGRFDTPMSLYNYLMKNKPDEELCLTHGDYCLPNIFITGTKATGFIDMGRGGIADKYQDIALCVRSLRYNTFGRNDNNLLFRHMGLAPDWDKIDYFILLDELF